MFHSGGIVAAFLMISYAHVVVGEVVPKNLALEKADRLALLVAPPLLIFGRLSAPFVFVAERSARSLSKLIGLSGEPSGGAHSPEELKFVVAMSRQSGQIRRFEEESILALLDLEEYFVREIMVPRNAIVSISVEANLDQVLSLMSENQFSRLPVYEKTSENIIGYVHYKDLMPIWVERRAAQEKRKLPRAFRVRRILRRIPIVPETKVLADLIDEFRNTHRHIALVVDEFGTIAGLVTLEDVLEQIFGEIGDEHDAKRPAYKAETPVIELDGSTSIRDLDAQYGIELPGDAGFETLAGFILYELGYIPKEGEQVVHEGRRFIVATMERNRIAMVRIEKIIPAPAPASPPQSLSK
jgi:CBS domain containing-hemolysin-like protein